MPKGIIKKEQLLSIATKAVTTKIIDRTVTGIASVFGVKDFGGDIINRGAFKKSIAEAFARVKFLWQHESWEPPIAAIIAMREIPKRSLPVSIVDAFPDATGGLEVTRKYLDTTKGNELLAGLMSDPPAITEMSIGYRAVKVEHETSDDGSSLRILKELELFDISDVNWGMNPATVAQKSAIPFFKTPFSPMDCEYDADAEVKDATADALMTMCLLFDPDKEEEKSYYMMPHHHNEAGFSVNWIAVKACMMQLIDPNDVAISEEDGKAIYDHLAEHYNQFGKEAPGYQQITVAYRANELIQSVNDPDLTELIAPLIKSVTAAISAEPAIKPLTDMDRKRALDARFKLLSL